MNSGPEFRHHSSSYHSQLTPAPLNLPAAENKVEGRARSWGWWMAPKRLGPGGRLRNSGFRPKSNLCGSDCICFYSTKGGGKDGSPRETVGKKDINEETESQL